MKISNTSGRGGFSMSGPISGKGGVVINGTCQILGTGTFTGNTKVIGGTLTVGNLTLQNSAFDTSGGFFPTFNSTTPQLGGILGQNNWTLPGTLTSLQLNLGTGVTQTYTGNLSGGAANGNLTLGGTLNVTDAGGFGPGAYTLFTYTGGLTYSGVVTGSVPPGLNYTIDTNTAGQVTLMVSGGGGPAASFTAMPASGYAPLAATFTDTSTGSITNRHWDFGNGTLDTTGTLVTNTYAAAGTYTVQLTVAGPDGSSSATHSNLVSVGAVPQPAFVEGSEFRVNPAGQATFHIETTNGVQYRIAYKGDLLNSNVWQGVTPPVPDGWTNGNNLAITLQDTNTVGVTQRFYRIEAKSTDAP